MEITIVRHGGLWGPKATLGPVDTAKLGIGGVIIRKIQQIEFFDLPERLPASGGPIADGFTYEMTVDDGERTHTVHYESASEADARRRLFEVQQLLIQADCTFRWEQGAAGLVAAGDFTWEAWYNRMPGSHDPDLHVLGTGVFESGSVQLVLEPGNVGVVPDPSRFVLDLTIVRPPIGDDRIAEKQASWSADVGPGITEVEIQGEAQATIAVAEVQ